MELVSPLSLFEKKQVRRLINWKTDVAEAMEVRNCKDGDSENRKLWSLGSENQQYEDSLVCSVSKTIMGTKAISETVINEWGLYPQKVTHL